MALQEAYSFTDGNVIVHSFLDSAVVYKCEGRFYNGSQILADKDNNMNCVWVSLI
jgi:hypothetical protein